MNSRERVIAAINHVKAMFDAFSEYREVLMTGAAKRPDRNYPL